MTLSDLLRRSPVDLYLVLLMLTVGVAAVIPARGVGADILAWEVYAAIATLFVLYGARLSPQAIWAGLSNWRLQGVIAITTYVVFPLVGLAIAWAAGPLLQPDLVAGLLFISVLPSTVQSSIAFTSIARGNVAASICAASLSNLLGVVLTPLLVSLLMGATGVGFSLEALKDIALQILLPFAVGQLLRPFIGEWLNRHKTLTRMVDRGSILIVVYSAFSAGVVAGIWSRVSVTDLLIVLVFGLVLLGIIILGTTIASRVLGFDTADEISIVFCGSKKSMATGIPMATILFAGHAVGLIVLPLMLFHQAQLFVCAVLARRYARRPEGGAV